MQIEQNMCNTLAKNQRARVSVQPFNPQMCVKKDTSCQQRDSSANSVGVESKFRV
jgi:hypothetical protein